MGMSVRMGTEDRGCRELSLLSTLFFEAGFVFSLDLRVSVTLAADLQGPARLHSPVLGFCRLMLLLALQTQFLMILSKLFTY